MPNGVALKESRRYIPAMVRVLLTPDRLHDRAPIAQRMLQSAGFEAVYPPPGASPRNAEELVEMLGGIDAVIAGMEVYSEDVLGRTELRVVSRAGVGYDSIDVAAATNRGIVVTITPGATDVSVAEHTLALMLAVFRSVLPRHRDVHAGNWNRASVPRLAGKTLGIIGLGRIGKALAPRATALGLTVIATDPVRDDAFAAQHGIEYCSFDELLARSDIVSLHAPKTPQTVDMIDRDALAGMKSGAVLLNTARGALVDETALCEALVDGRLLGAALDVFRTEPLPAESPLLNRDDVVLSPHIAGLDLQSQEQMAQMAAQNLIDLHKGRWPEPCVVNGELRDGWRW